MTQASVSSTATLSPGTRYVLAIANGSAGTVSPTFTGNFGTAGVVPENSTSAFTVAAGATKWIEFVAFTTGLSINDTTSTIYWLLTEVKP